MFNLLRKETARFEEERPSPLRPRRLNGLGAQRNQYVKSASLPHNTTDLDAAVMFLDDPASQRQAKASTVALGRKERAEDVRQLLFRDPAAGVRYADAGILTLSADFDSNGA